MSKNTGQASINKPLPEPRLRSGIAKTYSKYGMFVILIFIFIVAVALNQNFVSPGNLLNVLKNMAPIALAAFGMTFILILGMIDLSVGAVMALTGCVAAIIARDYGLVIPGILAAMAVGCLFGLLNGGVIKLFGIPAFIMTLTTQNIARGIALIVTETVPVNGMGDGFKLLGQGEIGGIVPIPIVIMAALLFLCWLILARTKFGRQVFATGGNARAAKASGVNTGLTVIKSFMLNGLLAGLAGVMLMSRLNSGQPTGGVGYEFNAITAVVIGGTSLMGGTGSMFGTFIGALIVAILDSIMLLQGVNAYQQYIIKGLVIALAVIADFKTKSILQRSS